MMLCPALALAVLAAPPPTAGSRLVKETAYARVALAQSLTRDPAVKDAVTAKNASGETLDEIQRKDTYWITHPRDPLRQAIVQAPCSKKLKDLVKGDAVIVEAFAMDKQGALVCSINETSDYWQGDEAKWQRTYQEGKDPFVDEPAFDASSGTYAIQVSVPMFGTPGQRIGALTLTLKLRR